MSLVDIREHLWGHTDKLGVSRCVRCGFTFDAHDGMPQLPEHCWQLKPADPAAWLDYHRALEATLLFHSASPWTDEKRRRWEELTGSEEATTRVLCDTIRKALG